MGDCDDILKKVIKAAARKDAKPLQIEALRCLCNIAGGNKQLVFCLIDNSVIPTLKQLLLAADTLPEVLELVIWCYGNIACENAQVRNENVLRSGVLPAIISVLK